MATVVSLTEARILELLNGWNAVGLTQQDIYTLLSQIGSSQNEVDAAMQEFREVTLPSIQEDVNEASNLLADLNENAIPNIQAELDQTRSELQDALNVDISGLQDGLLNGIEELRSRPKVFVQPDEPEPYDDLEERELVVGDTWFDSDDDNRQRIWNGAQWSTFGVDIPDFSLTVKKFLTTTHMIY